jgi:hypothetical protein
MTDTETAAIPAATISMQLTGAVGRADLGEMLADIAIAAASALANSAPADDVESLFAEALADLAERTKSGVARHAAAVLRGRRSWSAMTRRSAARPCASSSSLATAVSTRFSS